MTQIITKAGQKLARINLSHTEGLTHQYFLDLISEAEREAKELGRKEVIQEISTITAREIYISPKNIP